MPPGTAGGRWTWQSTPGHDFSEWKQSQTVDTLAAAYAETGDFEQAVKYEKRALAMPDMTAEHRAESQERLELYEYKKPYRETPK